MQYTILSFNVLRMRSPVLASDISTTPLNCSGAQDEYEDVVFDEGAMAQKVTKDWKSIATMIRESGAVIVALQEILDDKCMLPLQRELGGSWKYIVSDQISIRNGGVDGRGYYERYAFLWDERFVSVMHLDDPKKMGPHIETRSWSLKRPPYVARFIPNTLGCLPLMEIRVINAHIAFSVDAATKKRRPDLKDTPMRLEEYKTLAGKIFPKIAKERDGYCVYTFLAGDYNLSLSQVAGKVRGITTLQADATTLHRKFDTEERRSNPYHHNYDHFTVTDHELEYVQFANRIDGVRVTGYAPVQYLEKVSDHVPVQLGFDVSLSNNKRG